jgi:hypothetical protein
VIAVTGLSNQAIAQQGTLRQQLIGTWRMTSCDFKYFKAPFCPGNGSIAFGGNGQYTEVILGRDRPKLAGTPGSTPPDRTTVSAEAYKGIAQGTVAQFGTWSVDEATKTLTFHPENTFTRVNEGTDRKNFISLTGDELTITVANGGSTTWKKSPPLQQVAAVPAAAQEKTLKQQVQGAWNLISCDAKGPICADPSGSVSYNGNGRYTIMVAAKNRPIPASVVSTPGAAPRDKTTPEEYKAIAQGFAAQFRTWSVNEADKTITTHAEDGFIPRPIGGKATIVSVTADEMKTNGALGNAVWRRFK